MWTRAAVSPPVRLDTYTTYTSAPNDQRLEPEREQPTEGDQAQTDSDQPVPVETSTTVSPSSNSTSSSGPSTSGSSAVTAQTEGNTVQGPMKKRKTMKKGKMETTMKKLFEKFMAQQDKARKDTKEMEQRRIELEEKQEKGRRR